MANLEKLLADAAEADLRRFAAACCRTIPKARLDRVFDDAIGDAGAWDRVLTASERYAAGVAGDAELAAAVALAARVDAAEAWQSEPSSAAATAVHVALALHTAYDWPAHLDGGGARDAVLQVASEVGEAGGLGRPALVELWQRRFAAPGT
jgi:hypothetical protein